MRHYWGYGLNISSEIEIPELLDGAFTDADVVITLAKVPATLRGEVLFQKMFVTANEKEQLLVVPDIASFYSADGKQVIVEPAAGADLQSARIFLLGSVFASILHQRKCVPFHASGFLHNGKAILLCGNSGAGKSSVSAYFFKQQFPLFTDDVCVLKIRDDGKIQATPSYPILKLWDNSYETLQLSLTQQKKRIREHLPKYATLLHDTFDATPREISHLFLLDAESNVQQPQIKALTGMDAFEAVKKNVYKQYSILSVEQKKNLFTHLSAFIASVPVFGIQRPAGLNTFAEVASLIEEKIYTHA